MAGIKVTIDIDDTNAIRSLQRFNGIIDKTSKDTVKKTRSMDKAIGSFLGNLAAIASVKAFQFLKAQVQDAFRSFQQFEQGLINVTKTANLTTDETAQLSKNILQLSRVLPASTDELLDIATAAGQLGVKGTKNISLFTETVASLGRVSNLSGSEAATVLARILNITGEGVGTVDTFASVIVGLGNSFAATESEIALVTQEVAKATQQFGVSSGEAAALAAVLKSVGVRAEEAGGVLSKAFIAINQSINEGGKRLEKLKELTGLSGDEIKKQFGENAVGFFRTFLGSLNNVDGGIKNASKTLDGLGITGIRVNKVLPVLATNVDELDRSFGIMKDEVAGVSTSLKTELEAGLKSSVTQTDLFSNALDRAKIRLGENFAKAVSGALPFLTDFVDDIGDADSRIKNFAEDTDNIDELTKKIKQLNYFNSVLAKNPINNFLSDADNDLERNNERLKILNDRIREINAEASKGELVKLKQELNALKEALTVAGDDPIKGNFGLLGLIGGKDAAVARVKEIEDAIKAGQQRSLVGIEETEKAQTEIILTEAQQRSQFLQEIKDSEKALALENAELEKIEKQIAADDDLKFLSDNLGKRAAAEELYRIKQIKDESKRDEALVKLRKKASDQEKASIFDLRKFEDLTNKQKVQAQRETLSAIAGLSQSNNSTLFAIGKAASISLAGINVAEGVTKALAAFPPPFNFAAAAAVGAAGAVQIANIASAKPPSAGKFQEGGIVGGSSFTGDKLQASVNSGEVVFNRRQQENLFNAVNQGNLGGAPSVTINNPVLLEQGAVNTLIDQINDALEFNNKTLGAVT